MFVSLGVFLTWLYMNRKKQLDKAVKVGNEEHSSVPIFAITPSIKEIEESLVKASSHASASKSNAVDGDANLLKI